MSHSIKSGLNSKKVTVISQFAGGSRNANRENDMRATRPSDLFIEKKMANHLWVPIRHTPASPAQSLADTHTDTSPEGISCAIVDAAPDCILTIGKKHEIQNFNPAADQTFSLTHSKAIGKDFIETLIGQAYHDAVACAIRKVFNEGEQTFPYRIEVEAVRVDGSFFPAELALVAIALQSGPACTVFIRDISAEKRAETLQSGQTHIFKLIATGSPIEHILSEIANFAEQQSERALCSISRFNDDVECCGRPSRSVYVQPSEQMDGMMRAAQPPFCVSHGGIDSAHANQTAHSPAWATGPRHLPHHSIQTSASWPISGKSRKIFGTLALHFGEATAPTAHEEQVACICARLAGIAIERIAADEKVRYLAHYDGLTALPNRFLFSEYLNLALRNARRTGKKFAVLFVDLDRFKEINDTLGHATGDFVLRELAARMRDCLRNSDKIARMGGDEFYVLVEDLNDGRHAADIAQKLLDAASNPIQVNDIECQLSASIGISIYPQDGENSQTLVKNADCAMYRAKELGKNRHQFFSMPPLRSNAVPPLSDARPRDAAIMKNR